MVKIWPIHRHKWRYITRTKTEYRTLEGNISTEDQKFLINCICGKDKVYKLKGIVMSENSANKLIKAKGWEDYADVQISG